jgi:serine/threonine protein kinase
VTRPFGRYEILDRISAGGMAEVFRARDTVRGGTIALKRLLPNIAEDDDFIRMFEDEARIARQLEHPYIARMFDYGDVDGAYYIAFEFVDGKDLRRVFERSVQRRDPPPLPILLYVFTRVAEGLSFAHHRKDQDGRPAGIVHRDVTPQNIMISYSGDVKLIDFGIAKAKGKAVRTEAGTIKGKFGYMAPEQFTGENVDHRVDVFALGVCMWELLTLQRLFTGANELQVLDKVKNAVTVQPSHYNAAVPPELDRIVLKALAKKPDERYRAARDLYKDLYTLTQNTKAESTREDVAEYMRHAFGEGPVTSGIEAVQDKQEKRVMSDNKGSDLDIFEGLGKKSQPKVSSAPPPPPPPSGQQRASEPTQTAQPAPQTFDVQKKTLMGIPQPAGSAAPPPPPPSAGRISAPPPVPPPSGSMKAAPPPPPPGRGSLPPVPGVTTSPSTLPGLQAEKSNAKTDESPAPVSTRPAGNGAALEMDWDDEDEATHVYDKDSKSEAEAAAPVSQSRIPAGAPSATTKIENKTLMGMNGPGLQAPPPPPPPPHSQGPASGALRAAPPIPPPPSGSMRAAAASQPPISARPSHPSQSGIPAAPPSVGSALARASSVPSGTPGPVSNPLPPPPPGGPTVGRSSFPPPPPPGSVQPQQHQTVTAPMPMPGRPSAHPSQAPVGSMPPAQAVASQPPRNALEPTAMVRPQGGSKAGIFVGLAVLLLAIAGAAAIFFFVMPHTGRVMINATDAKGGNVNRLEVFLDGRKQCDTTPCAVEQVSAGAHQVKVLAQGYEPATKAISVESRKDSVVDLTLVPSSAGTGIKVSGTQAGVKLFIDGKEIGPLPQEVKDLTPGDHKIRIAERSSSDPTRDRYQPLERNVIVAKDEMQDLGAQNLKVVKGKATISLATPNARVYLVSGTDRRELPSDKLPMAVDIDTSKSWTLEAVKFGFQDYKQPISFEDGQAEKTFNITLDPKGGPVASGGNDSTPTPTPTFVQPQPKPQPQPTAATTAEKPAATAEKPAATADKPAPTAAAAGGEAFLNINSIPASSVVLDGKPIGNTPKVKVSVTPGTHTVLFINAEQGLKKQISVTVGAGETKPAIAKLKTE